MFSTYFLWHVIVIFLNYVRRLYQEIRYQICLNAFLTSSIILTLLPNTSAMSCAPAGPIKLSSRSIIFTVQLSCNALREQCLDTNGFSSCYLLTNKYVMCRRWRPPSLWPKEPACFHLMWLELGHYTQLPVCAHWGLNTVNACAFPRSHQSPCMVVT